MFAKAKEAYEAKPKPPNKANDLRKTLFPSSSPSASNGDIREQMKRSKAMPEKPRTHEPLASVSANPVPALRAAAGREKLASIYGRDDPFVDDSAVKKATPISSFAHVGVELFEDDFDDSLDLDFEEPVGLPTLPPTKPVKTSSSQGAVPWSTSPPSHLQPPPNRTISAPVPTTKPSLKRHSSGEDGPAPEDSFPAPRKRQLPKHWEEKAWGERVEEELSAKTPGSKRKDQLPWEATSSAVKEQKRQLKAGRKTKKDVNEEEFSPEEMQEITRAHMSKAMAISLSDEQEAVLDLVVNKGKSVFFTGPAGTGKSVLMKSIIADLKKKHVKQPDRVAVTASTGLAACNIGGITLHSFSGIGLGKEDASTLVKKIRRNAKAKQRWLTTKCLIIDEISMVDGDLFDKLSQIGRTIRNNGRPWGGIQLIITGDFFQLPPVPDSGARESKFAFDGATWNTSIDHTIGLTQIFRQRDPEFANMLNEMRLGRISDDTVRAFKSLARPVSFNDGITQTELFPTRNEVDNSNARRLRELKGESYRFNAHDAGDEQVRDRLLQYMMAPKSLDLKVGAQVMLIKNLDENLVNGSLGKVVAFGDADDMDGHGSDPELAQGKKKIKAFAAAAGLKQKYPIVEFSVANGGTQTVLIEPNDWKVELPNGDIQAQRTQIPLILAWALSIHKAQGQTLERVKVDLGKVFEKGQAYVALSRATSQEGLQVLRFEKHKVMAHPRVVEFYNRLYSADKVCVKPQKPVAKLSNFVYGQSAGSASTAAKASMAKPSFSSRQAPFVDLCAEEEENVDWDF